MKLCFTNSFMAKAHILPELYSRLHRRRNFNLIVHRTKYFLHNKNVVILHRYCHQYKS